MRRIKVAKCPVVLTVDGKAELVVQDAESYQSLLAIVDRIESVEGISCGLDDLKNGGIRPIEVVVANMRRY